MAFFDAALERQSYNGDQSSKKDSTTFVTLVVNGQQILTKDYCYISDVLGIGDPFSCTIPNPDGQYTPYVTPGQSVKLYMSDSQVNGGAQILFFTGIVVSRDFVSNMQGSLMRITCCDLGWHLQNNTAPVWLSLRGLRWDVLLKKLLDPSWGFTGVSNGASKKNKNLRLGRAGAALEVTPQAYPPVLPRIQVEPGETCADILIKYAKLSKLLINVTGDGILQVFSPDYTTPNFYSLYLKKSTDPTRNQNNVQSVSITDSIDGIYTDVSCYSVVLIPQYAQSNNPNEGHFKGLYNDSKALPFVHRISFADAEQLSVTQAKNRSVWKANRGAFDSFKYEAVVYGHQQNGSFYTPDTMCSIDDTVHNIRGNFYIQAVKYERDNQSGTKTTLTLRKAGLLAA